MAILSNKINSRSKKVAIWAELEKAKAMLEDREAVITQLKAQLSDVQPEQSTAQWTTKVRVRQATLTPTNKHVVAHLRITFQRGDEQIRINTGKLLRGAVCDRNPDGYRVKVGPYNRKRKNAFLPVYSNAASEEALKPYVLREYRRKFGELPEPLSYDRADNDTPIEEEVEY